MKAQEFVTIPKAEYESLLALIPLVEKLTKRVAELEEKLSIKNSSNSGIAPSKDENRNRSLRISKGLKRGGQQGHTGNTLKMTATPDKIIDLKPNYCSLCGSDVSAQRMFLKEKRQNIVIPPIQAIVEEYRNYACTCNCGAKLEGGFPSDISPGISYDRSCEALVAYLHSRQYIAHNRIAEMCKYVFNLSISEGTIQNMLYRFSDRIEHTYLAIKEKVSGADWLGCDETGVFVNTKKWWLWTWQNNDYTYLAASPSRGAITIENEFPDGFKHTTLVHDCLAAQFKVEASAHQICLPHLLRELNHLTSLYRNKWSSECKQVIKDIIEQKNQMDITHYYQPNDKVQTLEERLDRLLDYPIPIKHQKLKTFKDRLIKNRKSLTQCLYKISVPTDNNGSERAIRNVKVKQKISGHFRTPKGFIVYAKIRTVIDTLIKQNLNIFEYLKLASQIG